MSAQFGRWSFCSDLPPSDYFRKVDALLAPYGPDGCTSYTDSHVHILYRAFHTTSQSHLATQPCLSPSGIVTALDGRLDDRTALLQELKLDSSTSDVAIVAAAYERWGTSCFGRLVGDWALSIWNPAERRLLLAKDFIGARSLYYALERDQLTWGTTLDPLVLLSERSFEIDEEYVAGWLAFYPATHLTPFRGIQSVPPNSCVSISNGRATVSAYWQFNPNRQIRYRNDSDYEEHFRVSFAESLRRRLQSDAPVLAELSGGVDSSSIVCMADREIAKCASEAPSLYTISYFDDSEPNWNERPYFTLVERKRGRLGFHIDVSHQKNALAEPLDGSFRPTPGSASASTDIHEKFSAWAKVQGIRVVLSGIGGDEVLGGVPTPLPELADLFAHWQFHQLGRQLVAWALAQRRPVLHLAGQVAALFLPLPLRGKRNLLHVNWLTPDFARRHRRALEGYDACLKLFGPSPSFQNNLAVLDVLRRQLGCSQPTPLREDRYPFLDRDLLEFLFSIPREQLLRPNQRRSLMRRALAGIVPDEILHRKRKAYVVRAPLFALSNQWSMLAYQAGEMISASRGFVDPGRFLDSLKNLSEGRDGPVVPALRTLSLERWLRTAMRARCFAFPHHTSTTRPIIYSRSEPTISLR
jgi:asparagine synthase (glutamine-hydrolysing)